MENYDREQDLIDTFEKIFALLSAKKMDPSEGLGVLVYAISMAICLQASEGSEYKIAETIKKAIDLAVKEISENFEVGHGKP